MAGKLRRRKKLFIIIGIVVLALGLTFAALVVTGIITLSGQSEQSTQAEQTGDMGPQTMSEATYDPKQVKERLEASPPAASASNDEVVAYWDSLILMSCGVSQQECTRAYQSSVDANVTTIYPNTLVAVAAAYVKNGDKTTGGKVFDRAEDAITSQPDTSDPDTNNAGQLRSLQQMRKDLGL